MRGRPRLVEAGHDLRSRHRILLPQWPTRALGHLRFEPAVRLSRFLPRRRARFKSFRLLVKTRLKKWPEPSERKVRWLSVPEAAAVIHDGDLRNLILELEKHRRSVLRKHKGARQK